jgi:hypothetical protein
VLRARWAVLDIDSELSPRQRCMRARGECAHRAPAPWRTPGEAVPPPPPSILPAPSPRRGRACHSSARSAMHNAAICSLASQHRRLLPYACSAVCEGGRRALTGEQRRAANDADREPSTRRGVRIQLAHYNSHAGRSRGFSYPLRPAISTDATAPRARLPFDHTPHHHHTSPTCPRYARLRSYVSRAAAADAG